jgi:hypothetical protein
MKNVLRLQTRAGANRDQLGPSGAEPRPALVRLARVFASVGGQRCVDRLRCTSDLSKQVAGKRGFRFPCPTEDIKLP